MEPLGYDPAVFIAIVLSLAFFTILLAGVVIPQALTIFTKRLGRQHAVTGGLYLSWLLFGFYDAVFPTTLPRWVFDAVLGILGTVLTLTAAFNFGHKNVKNVASGTLDEHATVTYNEMIEHSFYQLLNLVQALFLHSVCGVHDQGRRLVLAVLATAPWLARGYFPIHPFSDNYTKDDERSSLLVREMYRVKKYQYMFYKHFLLHGLNVSVAVSGVCLSNERIFRLYWLLLNASYVLEFFLQTLVKKRYMAQRTMLTLQVLLMSASTAAAWRVLPHVSVGTAVLSLGLNMVARKRDVSNTLHVIAASLLLSG
jgi:hypothetical protein